MMAEVKNIYLIVSGASSARCVPDLLRALVRFDLPIYTLLTEGARNIISPYNLADQEGHTLVEGYFAPAMLTDREPGLTLVAPATFNTLNKIGQGIADTLPHSLVAEAIGAGWPVIVVPSMNEHLSRHPRVAQSMNILRQWGVTVLEPQLTDQLMMMASVDEIIKSVRVALEREG